MTRSPTDTVSSPALRGLPNDQEIQLPRFSSAGSPSIGGSAPRARRVSDMADSQELSRKASDSNHMLAARGLLRKISLSLFSSEHALPEADLVAKTVSKTEAKIYQTICKGKRSAEIGVLKCLRVREKNNEECEILMPLAQSTLTDCLANIKRFHSENQHYFYRSVMDFLNNMVVSLSTLAEHNVLHRDIKPDNIVYRNGAWVLIDFGSASMGDDATHQEALKKMSCTIAYAAPENTSPQEFISATAIDAYSIGIILFDMLNDITAVSRKTTECDAGAAAFLALADLETLLDKSRTATKINYAEKIASAENLQDGLTLFANWLKEGAPENRPTLEQFRTAVTKLNTLFSATFSNVINTECYQDALTCKQPAEEDDDDDNLLGNGTAPAGCADPFEPLGF